MTRSDLLDLMRSRIARTSNQMALDRFERSLALLHRGETELLSLLDEDIEMRRAELRRAAEQEKRSEPTRGGLGR